MNRVSSYTKRREGQREFGFAILPLVVMVGLLVASIAGLLSFLGVSEIGQRQQADNALRAYSLAVSGVNDAQLRILRNGDFEDQQGYELLVDEGLASVIVQNYPFSSPCVDTGSSGQKCVISTGTYGNTHRRVQMIVTVGEFGDTTIDSFREIIP